MLAGGGGGGSGGDDDDDDDVDSSFCGKSNKNDTRGARAGCGNTDWQFSEGKPR